jgi:peptide/nickel transport system permease protein/oligopeptide transport system permease protein
MFFLRKIFLGFFYLFLISVVAFIMVRQMPGDPAVLIANQNRETEAPPEVVERIREEYGFNRPLPEQYWRWLKRGVLEGDLGLSTRTRQPVTDAILDSLPASLRLAGITFGFTLLLSFPLGLLAGVTRNQQLDAVIRGVAWINYSLPVFLLAVVGIWLFAVEWNLLPAIGHSTPRHMILPVAVLTLHLTGWNTQLIRSSVREIAEKPYIQVAHAKGLSYWRVVLIHILKPALLPILTAFLIQLGNLFSGSFIIETIFAWNGIGRLLVDSILARDFPVIQGILLYVGAVFALINLLIDLLYRFLNPSTIQALGRGRHG